VGSHNNRKHKKMAEITGELFLNQFPRRSICEKCHGDEVKKQGEQANRQTEQTSVLGASPYRGHDKGPQGYQPRAAE